MRTMLPAIGVTFLVLGALLGDPPGGRPEVVHEFSTITAEHAQQFEGEEATYAIELDSLPDEEGKYALYDCKSEDEVVRSVWLLRGRDIKPKMTLRARLSIVHHPGYTAGDGTVFPSVEQYRLVDAAQER